MEKHPSSPSLALVALLCSLLLAGCGQKGGLTRPESPAPEAVQTR